MKKLLFIVSGIICGTAFGAQEHILDVCIHVDASVALRRSDVGSKHLEKYNHFGMKKAQPFDRYFVVTAARYVDHFNHCGHVQVEKNFIQDVPSQINIISLPQDEFKSARFPKYVPESFIEKIKKHQAAKKLFEHIVYENQERSFKIRYTIQEHQNVMPELVSNRATNYDNTHNSSSLFFENFMSIVDALLLLATTNR
jgi:hypothetical protein